MANIATRYAEVVRAKKAGYFVLFLASSVLLSAEFPKFVQGRIEVLLFPSVGFLFAFVQLLEYRQIWAADRPRTALGQRAVPE